MKCKWCNSIGYKKQGQLYLCKKHYRFQRMRVMEKYNGKEVPSYKYLESLNYKNCYKCKVKMNWLAKDGRKTMITLQHDRDGTIRFLCMSCNGRHANFKDDKSFYQDNPNKKLCHECGKIKSLKFFHKYIGSFKKVAVYCKKCMRKITKNWYKNNKEKRTKRAKKWRKLKEEILSTGTYGSFCKIIGWPCDRLRKKLYGIVMLSKEDLKIIRLGIKVLKLTNEENNS